MGRLWTEIAQLESWNWMRNRGTWARACRCNKQPRWVWYPRFQSRGSLLSGGKWINFANRWKISASVNWLYMVVWGPNVFFAVLQMLPLICLHSSELSVMRLSAHKVCLAHVPLRKTSVPSHTWAQRPVWKCALLPSKWKGSVFQRWRAFISMQRPYGPAGPGVSRRCPQWCNWRKLYPANIICLLLDSSRGSPQFPINVLFGSVRNEHVRCLENDNRKGG